MQDRQVQIREERASAIVIAALSGEVARNQAWLSKEDEVPGLNEI